MIKLDNGHFISYEHMGEFHSDAAWIHPVRSIKSYEIILVLEGTVYLHEDEKEYILNPNDVIILEPELIHGGSKTVTEPVAFYWLHFYTDLPLPMKVLSDQDLYEVRQLLRRLLHLTNTTGYSCHAADATVLLILEEFSKIVQERTTDSRVNISQITEYIRIHSDRKLTVSALARHFHYNPDYIAKLFQKHLGIGPKEYIAQQRLKKAKDLLLTTDLPIKLLATELGYEQENLFIKFFQYHEKISPTAFRNQYYNTHMNNK